MTKALFQYRRKSGGVLRTDGRKAPWRQVCDHGFGRVEDMNGHVQFRCVVRAGTFAPGAVAEVLRSSQFETALGHIGFDEKGDVTGYDTYVWYVWQGGEFVPLKETP